MNKNILLVEPAYKSKYPPLGLMKLATYHKKMNQDNVTFVRGCDKKARDEFWDRVYISTSFTYTWDESVKTINFYNETLFKFSRKMFVGGILATILADELYNATGIMPVSGLLDDPKKIEQDDNVIIDELPPDYSILSQVEKNGFKYSYTDAYLGYATRGCIRHCDFCAVRTLEPHYKSYIDIHKWIGEIKSETGEEKQNLLLMDNNILASGDFDKIIDDIKSVGFVKGAKFGPTRRHRFIDFNQGLDGRLLTEHKMSRLAEIPLEPMRIAFDNITSKEAYVKAVRLAHKYGQRDMSNYILYNHNDTPEDFYERLRINVDLNDEFEKEAKKGKGVKTAIYSFPMRFMPLTTKRREDVPPGKHWNKKYLRSIQVILSVMRGPVMPGKRFFLTAFGKSVREFREILLMPEDFIRYRMKPNYKKIDQRSYERYQPYVAKWLKAYRSMTSKEKQSLAEILAPNEMGYIHTAFDNSKSKKLKELLKMTLNAKHIAAKRKK